MSIFWLKTFFLASHCKMYDFMLKMPFLICVRICAFIDSVGSIDNLTEKTFDQHSRQPHTISVICNALCLTVTLFANMTCDSLEKRTLLLITHSLLSTVEPLLCNGTREPNAQELWQIANSTRSIFEAHNNHYLHSCYTIAVDQKASGRRRTELPRSASTI